MQISTEYGGSTLAYRYGEWAEVDPARRRIKDLACMIQKVQPQTEDTESEEGEAEEEEEEREAKGSEEDAEEAKHGHKEDARNDTANKIDVN